MPTRLPRAPKLTAALLLGAASFSSTSANAQCASGWIPGSANSDMSALIRWLDLWDADGPGPIAPVLVAAGDFNGAGSAGSAEAAYVASWDGANWSPLGLGLNGPGYCLTSLTSNNRLYVAGASFSQAGGNPAKRIASWDGSTWAELGTGEGNVPSLALLTCAAINADTLVVSGAFTSVAGVSALRIASYNTTTGWSALGPGLSSTTSAVCVMPNGDVIAGGAGLTTGDGSVTLNRIGRWDGAQWHALGNGLDGLVRCLLVMPNGDLIAGGAFNLADAAPRIARWDGTQWHGIGGGMNGDVYALAVMPNGDLIAGGDFLNAGGTPVNRIARWNGSSWSAMGAGVSGLVRALEVLPNGELAVGGDFLTAGGQPSAFFARWSDGASPVNITQQPQSVVTDVNATEVFTVAATGGQPITYQWQQQDLFTFDYIDIQDGPVLDPFNNVICTASGTATSELTLSNFSGTAQMFRCLVSNACGSVPSSEFSVTFGTPCGTADFDGDGDTGTDADIEAFFACLAGNCCATCYAGGADFNADGDTGTDADIESFFRVLAGGDC